jgi:hypothetical protein
MVLSGPAARKTRSGFLQSPENGIPMTTCRVSRIFDGAAPLFHMIAYMQKTVQSRSIAITALKHRRHRRYDGDVVCFDYYT